MKKTKEEKVAIKKEKMLKAFVCRVCREQFGHESIRPKNVTGTCPSCGGSLKSKVMDEKETHGKAQSRGLSGA